MHPESLATRNMSACDKPVDARQVTTGDNSVGSKTIVSVFTTFHVALGSFSAEFKHSQ